MKKNKLKEVSLDEISLVDKGANQCANVLLFKRDNMTEEEKEKAQELKDKEKEEKGVKKNAFDEALAVTEALDDLWKLQDALRCAVKEIMEDDKENKFDRINSSIDSYANKLKEKFNSALSEKDSIVAMIKREIDFISKLNKEQFDYYKTLDDVAKQDYITQENGAEELAKCLANDEVIEVNNEKICKSKVGDPAFAIMKKMAEEKAEAENKLAEEVAKRQEQEIIAKAETLLKDYPLADIDMVSVYKSFAKLSDEDRTNFEAVLKAGAAALQGLTEQVSKNNASQSASELTDEEKVKQVIKRMNEKDGK